MNHITMHGSLTVNGRTVIVHVGDGEANATVDGTHFNVRSLWQLYQLLRLLVYRLIKARCPLPCLVGPDGRGRVAGSGMTFLPCRR